LCADLGETAGAQYPTVLLWFCLFVCLPAAKLTAMRLSLVYWLSCFFAFTWFHGFIISVFDHAWFTVYIHIDL